MSLMFSSWSVSISGHPVVSGHSFYQDTRSTCFNIRTRDTLLKNVHWSGWPVVNACMHACIFFPVEIIVSLSLLARALVVLRQRSTGP